MIRTAGDVIRDDRGSRKKYAIILSSKLGDRNGQLLQEVEAHYC
jgi:hypothetical protein